MEMVLALLLGLF